MAESMEAGILNSILRAHREWLQMVTRPSLVFPGAGCVCSVGTVGPSARLLNMGLVLPWSRLVSSQMSPLPFLSMSYAIFPQAPILFFLKTDPSFPLLLKPGASWCWAAE